MKDLLGLMGKAKEMQAKFQAMQDEIATLEASGQAGGCARARADNRHIARPATVPSAGTESGKRSHFTLASLPSGSPIL